MRTVYVQELKDCKIAPRAHEGMDGDCDFIVCIAHMEKIQKWMAILKFVQASGMQHEVKDRNKPLKCWISENWLVTVA